MTTTVIIDTNLLVALIDERDKWHTVAIALRDALLATGAQVIYLDCVIQETVSVVARRTEEQGRSEQFAHLLDTLVLLIPQSLITWSAVVGIHLFPRVLALCREHQGRLNYNDALIALICRENDIRTIASFDADFDQVPWLVRVADPGKVKALGQR